MIITFYGVRGSTSVAGPSTVKYGGNTSCVHIELENGNDLILDAGTGIRLLGNKLARKSAPANILLSHGHWDHIQGYPFFAPIYQPDRDIHVYISMEKGRKLLSTLFEQVEIILVNNPDLFQQRKAVLDAPLRIIDKRAPRRSDRKIDIGRTAGTDLGEGFFGGGIDNIDSGRGDRVNPGTVDIKFEMIHLDMLPGKTACHER